MFMSSNMCDMCDMCDKIYVIFVWEGRILFVNVIEQLQNHNKVCMYGM